MAKFGGAKLDLTELKRQVQGVTTDMATLNTELGRIDKSEAKADSSGKVFQVRLESMDDAGKRLITTMTKLGKEIQTVTKAIATEPQKGMGLDKISQQDYLARQFDILKKGGFADQYRRSLETAFGEMPEKAARAQQNRARNALQGLMKGMLSEGWSQSMINNVIGKMAVDRNAIFMGKEEQRIQQFVTQYAKAQEDGLIRTNQIDQRIFRKRATLLQATQLGGAAQETRSWLYSKEAFGPMYARRAAFDERAATQAQGYFNRLQGYVKSGAISRPDLQNLFKQWDFGKGQLPTNLDAIKSKAVQAFNQIHLGLTKGTQLAVPFYERMQGIYHLFMAYIGIRWYQYITSGFKAATEAAAEFQRQIALTQTISQEAGQSDADWMRAYKNVAMQGPFDPSTVARAGIDLLSNQITQYSTDTEIALKKSQDFARVTGGELRDSVDALSSGLNAYGVGIDQADNYFSQFFATIDYGRIKVDELQKTMGRLNTFAGNVGSKLSEALGGVALLTRKGIQPETAQTLLLNVYQKLLNPTEKMQKVLDDMGVSTGDNLVKTYGWVGALQKLYQAAHGSASEIADMFGEIRGGQGAMILMKNLAELAGDIGKIEGYGDKYAATIEIMNKNPGQKLYEELNKIETYLTTDFKMGFLNVFTKMNDGLINFSTLITGIIDQLKIAVPMLITAYGAIKLDQVVDYGMMMYRQQAAMAGLSSMGGVMLAGGGGGTTLTGGGKFGAAISAVASIPAVQVTAFLALEAVLGNIVDQAIKFGDEMERASEIQHDKNLKTAKEELEKILADVSKERTEIDALTSSLDKGMRAIATGAMKEINKQLDELKPKLEEITKGLRDKFDVVLSEMRRVADYWRSVSTEAGAFAAAGPGFRENLQAENFESSFRLRLAEVKRARSNEQAWTAATDVMRPEEARGGGGSAYANVERKIYEDYYKQLNYAKNKAAADIEVAKKNYDFKAFKEANDRYNDTIKKMTSLLSEMGSETLSSTSHIVTGYDQEGREQYSSYQQSYLLVPSRVIRDRSWNLRNEQYQMDKIYRQDAGRIKAEADKREVLAKEATEKTETFMDNFIRGAITTKEGKLKPEFEKKEGETTEQRAERMIKAQQDLANQVKTATQNFMSSNLIPKDIQEKIRPTLELAIKSMMTQVPKLVEARETEARLKQDSDYFKQIVQNTQDMVEEMRRLTQELTVKQVEAETAANAARYAVTEHMAPLQGAMPKEGLQGFFQSMYNNVMPPEMQEMQTKIMGLDKSRDFSGVQETLSQYSKMLDAWGYLQKSGWKAENITTEMINNMLKTGQGPTGPSWHGVKEMRPYGFEQQMAGRDYLKSQYPKLDISEAYGKVSQAAKLADEARIAAIPVQNQKLILAQQNAEMNQMAGQAGLMKHTAGGATIIDPLSKGFEKLISVAPQAGQNIESLTTKFLTFSNNFKNIEPAIEQSMAGYVKVLKDSAEEINRISASVKISRPESAEELNRKYRIQGIGVNPPGSTSQRLGGRVRHFFFGGPVGTDTVPAWLGTNEFVMNGQATRRWHSQLQDMNSGRSPDFASQQQRPQGPAIGNLHINVNGGQSNKQTASEIASALQRAINLGSVRLRTN